MPRLWQKYLKVKDLLAFRSDTISIIQLNLNYILLIKGESEGQKKDLNYLVDEIEEDYRKVNVEKQEGESADAQKKRNDKVIRKREEKISKLPKDALSTTPA